jgi:hypothetical protein
MDDHEMFIMHGRHREANDEMVALGTVFLLSRLLFNR